FQIAPRAVCICCSSTALGAIWNVVGEANKYFAGQEPWALKKTDPERMATVLNVTAEVVRRVAIMAQPAMPESCHRLLDQMGVPEDARQFVDLDTPPAARVIEKPEGIFPRYVEPDNG
ncbi:MAG: hypothetical protein AAGK33_11910, partial [Pseudomonadota bacterium]